MTGRLFCAYNQGMNTTITAIVAEEVQVGDRILYFGEPYDVDGVQVDGHRVWISLGAEDVPELELIQRPLRGLVHLVVGA